MRSFTLFVHVMREQGREDAFVDPLADIDTINLELILADLESVNKRYARVEKVARTQKDKDSVAEFNVLQKIKPVLEDGKSARTIEFTEDEQKIVKQLFLLTTKPVLYVANVDEDKVANPDDIEYVKQIREFAATENAEVVVISARAEEEISELDDEDKEFKFVHGHLNVVSKHLKQLVSFTLTSNVDSSVQLQCLTMI